MRVFVNTRFLLSGKLEGIGLFTHEIMSRMVKSHPEDEFFFCFDRKPDPVFFYSENVVPLRAFPPARHPLLFYLWFEKSLPLLFKKYNPDVFLSPDGFCSLDQKAPKTLLVLHDLAYHHFPEHLPGSMLFYYKKYTPLFLEKADKVVTVSEFSRQDILNTFHLEEKKVSVCHNGCRSFFHPVTESQKRLTRIKYTDGQPFFLFVGALHPRKNLIRLIKAFNLFKYRSGSPAKLIVAGRKGWKFGEFMSSISSSPFSNDILLPGYVSDQELASLMGAAICFVYPSLWEGFGMPLLEAMKSEVPVIASKASSLPEIGGDAVFWTDPYSAETISEALFSIWENQDLRQDLIRKGKIQVSGFSWDRSADCLYSVLKLLA